MVKDNNNGNMVNDHMSYLQAVLNHTKAEANLIKKTAESFTSYENLMKFTDKKEKENMLNFFKFYREHIANYGGLNITLSGAIVKEMNGVTGAIVYYPIFLLCCPALAVGEDDSGNYEISTKYHQPNIKHPKWNKKKLVASLTCEKPSKPSLKGWKAFIDFEKPEK